MRNRLSGIQMLGTNLCTIHNRMTPVQFKRIIQLIQTLLRRPIPRIFNPTIGLHQDSRSQVLVGIPPIRRTRRTTARTQNTLVHAIQFGTILSRLQKLALTLALGIGGLQPRFNGTVLFVEIAHVGDQVLDDVHVREWINLGGLLIFFVNVIQTRERVDPVNVHGATATNAFATGTAKGEGGILFVLDFNESVQYHGAAVIEIDGICGL